MKVIVFKIFLLGTPNRDWGKPVLPQNGGKYYSNILANGLVQAIAEWDVCIKL